MLNEMPRIEIPEDLRLSALSPLTKMLEMTPKSINPTNKIEAA